MEFEQLLDHHARDEEDEQFPKLREHIPQDLDERREIADTVIAEVMRHSVAEEMIVYPSIEEHVPGGKDEVEHDKEEHEELVRVMKELEDLDVTEGAFLEKVIEFEQLLDHHARDEEDEQFPKLREHIPQD
ncbi:cation-binding protein, partial [Shigella flexneri]